MEERIVYLNGEVNEISALNVIMELLNYDAEDPKTPIYLYLNSNGGSVVHGLGIYDTIKHINAPVYMVCAGLAASMGAFLLSCGEKGHRAALKHSQILIHQPLIRSDYSYPEKESDIRKEAEGLLECRQILESIMAENTNKPLEVLHKDMERDNWMNAEEAKEYGLIDEII